MSFRAALQRALWWGLLAILAGCGSLPFGAEPKDEHEAKPKSAPQFRLEVEAPQSLQALLLQHLDLARLLGGGAQHWRATP